MKIFQINACCNGSTGRTAVELAQSLTVLGHQSIIAYSEGPSLWKTTYKIGNKLDHKLHALLSRLTGLQGYFSIFPTLRLLWELDREKPDVVHLRNLHANYINLPILFRYLSKRQIPTVITLHDCWWFTGKCTHYTARQCYKWQNECHHCKALKQDNQSYFFDFSRKMFKNRYKWFHNLSCLYVLGVSEWTRNEARKASVFSTAKYISHIYNWIDVDTFSPKKGKGIKNLLSIESNNKVVLAVSGGWTSNQKTSELNALAELLPEGYVMIIVGHKAESVTFHPRSKHIEYVENVQRLAELYSIADVYVHLSVEDTFGKVIAEAMACGTPTIVFNSTALPELVDSSTGAVVEPHNIDAMIREVLRLTCGDKSTYLKPCRDRVIHLFERNKNVSKYLDIYKQMIEP